MLTLNSHRQKPTDLNGLPVEYRELQSHESPQFLSYFPHKFLLQRGGVATGFHHVSSPPPDTTRRLYRVTNLTIREVPAEGSSVVQGDAYVLDMGKHVWQFNAKGSVGKERFRAAEFVRELVEGRMGGAEVTVFGTCYILIVSSCCTHHAVTFYR